MALITKSMEMSFSLSRLRNALRSMSTRLPHVVAAELHLNLPGSQFAEAELTLLTVDVEHYSVGVGRRDPAGHGVARGHGGAAAGRHLTRSLAGVFTPVLAGSLTAALTGAFTTAPSGALTAALAGDRDLDHPA